MGRDDDYEDGDYENEPSDYDDEPYRPTVRYFEDKRGLLKLTLVIIFSGFLIFWVGSLFTSWWSVPVPVSDTSSETPTKPTSIPKPNSDLVKILSINEDDGTPSEGLLQKSLAETTTITSNPDGTIKFQYFVPQDHCGDVKVHVLLNGNEASQTRWMGNYQNNKNIPLNSGIIAFDDGIEPNTDYLIGFYPEGRYGGCIVNGYIPSWFGTVEFYR